MIRDPHTRARLIGVSCFVATLLASCDRPVQQISLTREKMSTLVTITVFARSPKRAEKAIQTAFERMDHVIALVDRHRPDSEVSRLAASKEPMPLSDETWRLLETAKAMSQRTGGAFDVTVGPLLVLWKQCAKAERLPSEAELKQARSRVGSEHVELADGSARLAKEGMKVDLGGVAKGYAVDAAVATLRQQGIRSALVNAGGDMAMLGPRPGAPGWLIGVQDPRGPDDPPELVCTLQLPACAVATSGSYQRYVEIEGKRLSHIVDPRTGWPCARVPSVTIVARSNATVADMWATAASVLSPEESIRLIDDDDDLEALLVTVEPSGELSFTMSKGFAQLVKEWRVPVPE